MHGRKGALSAPLPLFRQDPRCFQTPCGRRIARIPSPKFKMGIRRFQRRKKQPPSSEIRLKKELVYNNGVHSQTMTHVSRAKPLGTLDGKPICKRLRVLMRAKRYGFLPSWKEGMKVSDLPVGELVSLSILSEMQDMLPDDRKPLQRDVEDAIESTLVAIKYPESTIRFSEFDEIDMSALSMQEREREGGEITTSPSLASLAPLSAPPPSPAHPPLHSSRPASMSMVPSPLVPAAHLDRGTCSPRTVCASVLF